MIMQKLRRRVENWKDRRSLNAQSHKEIVRVGNQLMRDKYMQALSCDLVELMKSSGAVRRR